MARVLDYWQFELKNPKIMDKTKGDDSYSHSHI